MEWNVSVNLIEKQKRTKTKERNVCFICFFCFGSFRASITKEQNKRKQNTHYTIHLSHLFLFLSFQFNYNEVERKRELNWNETKRTWERNERGTKEESETQSAHSLPLFSLCLLFSFHYIHLVYWCCVPSFSFLLA